MNTSDPTGWARYEIESTSYHEGIPGHHLQLAIAAELESVPEFRKRAFIAAYGEGWGLYTERLADEMGLYSSPLDRMGMLSADSMRACRLVVDTGMHALGWSRRQAIDYMLANSPMREGHVTAEIDRYAVTPGQALAYMIGRLEIQRIRREAEAALGDRFRIKEFHDTVLGRRTDAAADPGAARRRVGVGRGVAPDDASGALGSRSRRWLRRRLLRTGRCRHRSTLGERGSQARAAVAGAPSAADRSSAVAVGRRHPAPEGLRRGRGGALRRRFARTPRSGCAPRTGGPAEQGDGRHRVRARLGPRRAGRRLRLPHAGGRRSRPTSRRLAGYGVALRSGDCQAGTPATAPGRPATDRRGRRPADADRLLLGRERHGQRAASSATRPGGPGRGAIHRRARRRHGPGGVDAPGPAATRRVPRCRCRHRPESASTTRCPEQTADRSASRSGRRRPEHLLEVDQRLLADLEETIAGPVGSTPTLSQRSPVARRITNVCANGSRAPRRLPAAS